MGINKLISLAAALAVLTVSTGQLPRLLKVVSSAWLILIQDSKASKWGQPWLPPQNK